MLIALGSLAISGYFLAISKWVSHHERLPSKTKQEINKNRFLWLNFEGDKGIMKGIEREMCDGR